MGSDLTGRAIFERDKERLIVFTANRRPLEQVFGVDLIYLDEGKQNIVMLQYKMLEPFQNEVFGDDWIYRPEKNLDRELDRMKKFAATLQTGSHEYRLNSCSFYFKFVKRDSLLSGASIILPIEHFEKLLTDPASKGPRGGLYISYQSLSGRYLRQNSFIDLIRSGYIGSHAEKTMHLKELIDATLKNGKAVIAAIQQPVENGTNSNGDLNFDEKYIPDI
jgi:hypothetical protein